MIGSFSGEGGRFLLPAFVPKNLFKTKIVKIKGKRKITKGCNHDDKLIVSDGALLLGEIFQLLNLLYNEVQDTRIDPKRMTNMFVKVWLSISDS